MTTKIVAFLAELPQEMTTSDRVAMGICGLALIFLAGSTILLSTRR